MQDVGTVPFPLARGARAFRYKERGGSGVVVGGGQVARRVALPVHGVDLAAAPEKVPQRTLREGASER